MNADEIFKRPALPTTSTSTSTSTSSSSNPSKRKFEPPAPPSYTSEKSLKLNASIDVKGKGKGVTIKDGNASDSDEEEENDGRNGDGRGDEFAPGGDADYFAEEDSEEGGRFFGGGLNTVQKEVLNIMENGSLKTDESELTSGGIKKQLLNLEKGINKNRDMRTKFPNNPEKFVDSEFNLLELISSLLLLAQVPTLSYPLLIELSTPTSLCDLLSHENSDVVIAVIELLEEWTDEEVLEVDDNDEGDEQDDEEEGEGEKRRKAMSELVKGFLEAGLVELVVGGLERLKEDEEEERAGVFHTLGLLENLISLDPKITTSLLLSSSPFLSYLLKRLGQDKLPSDRDQNRFYAGELLSIVLGTEVDGVKEARERLASIGGVDGLLRVLSAYRRRDPSSADELEFMENIFDSLCSSLSSPLVKISFLKGEGIELMCLMLKEKKLSRTRAIKTLDHALQGSNGSGVELCEKFVELLGLKTLFSAFMGKGSTTKKSKAEGTTYVSTEHVLSLLSSLLTSLASDSPARLRLLTKFVENDYEKIDRLIELREEIEGRVNSTNASTGELGGEGEELDEEDLYLEKLEKGLFSLQRVDYIVAWLCMEDDGMRDHILMLLARRDKSFSDVMRVLIEYRENIGDPLARELEEQEAVAAAASGKNGEGKEGGEVEEGKEVNGEMEDDGEEQRAILAELITYLQSIDN